MQKLAAPAVPMEVRLHARVSPRMREIQTWDCALEASGVHRLFQEHCGPGCGPRVPLAKGVAVVHEMKRPGRGALELLKVAGGDRPRKGKTIGDVTISDEDVLATALRLRDDERL